MRKKEGMEELEVGRGHDEVGMPHRRAEKFPHLSPRYPLIEPDEISCQYIGEKDRSETHIENETVPLDRLSNQWMLNDENKEVAHGVHPWKPKGRV